MKRIFGLLGWLGVVLVLAAVVMRFVKPEQVEVYQGLALAGLVVTLLFTLSQWRDIARSMSGRSAKYGSMTAGSVLLMIGILIAINYIGQRQSKRWDLTGGGQFSLSDQSKKIVGELKQPLKARVYYQTGNINAARDRLDLYTQASSNFQVEYIDAQRNPVRAQQDGITQYGTTIMEYGGRTERIMTLEEQDVTNAIIKLVQGKTKKVYVVQGHGEHDINGQDAFGYTRAVSLMKNDNYDVATLNLAQEGKVPDDATLLLVPGPQTDFLPGEIDEVKAFLDKGGKLFLMMDVPAKPDAPVQTNLVQLAKDWGMAVGNNVVVDLSGMGRMFNAGPEVPIAMSYPAHPITENFRAMTGYRLARSVTPIDGGANGRTAQRIVESSPRSWAEADLKSLTQAGGGASLDESKGDIKGPVSLAAAVSAAATAAPPSSDPDAKAPETRVVVMGDADMACNGMIQFQGNGDLFQNIVNWTAQNDALIAIHPKDPQDRRITLTESQRNAIFYLAIFIIPGIFLAAGVAAWWKRR